MLSKEEIENVEHAIKNFNGKLIDCLAIGEMLKEYNKLANSKQKLIKMLEAVKQKDESWNALNGELAVWTFAREILNLLKGENNV